MRVLIDVDGVLLRQNIYEPQADCIVQASLEVGGALAAATALSWDWVGRTDLDILKHAVGEARANDARDEYLRLFRHACPENLLDQVTREVQEAIYEAVDEMGFSFIPVTGNLEPVARMKLARARYDAYLNLDAGGYGEHGSRPAILGNTHHKLPQPVVYVGDTWRDLAAARLVGVPFIGWETEKHRGELEAADWVARNCEDLVNAFADAAWGAPVN